MMKNFGMIFFLVFFGVLIILVGVGWILYMILFILLLVVCFVFGVVLGLMDVVVVGLLLGWIDIFECLMNILFGEGFINDVLGVIVF